MKEAIVQIQGLNFCYQKEKPLFQDTRAVLPRSDYRNRWIERLWKINIAALDQWQFENR